jgi:peptide/nickel transport system substrate-binding protein
MGPGGTEVGGGLRHALTAASLGIAAVFAVAACGGGGDTPHSTTSAPAPPRAASTVADGERFPVFRVATDAGIDYLDPGLSYTSESSVILWNVYLPLIGYRHVNGPGGATIVPYLAKSMPRVSRDGKTYTLTLRKGLTYSDGTPVKASDFRATIERDYEVDSPGAFFFDGVVGAHAYGKTKKGHIGGIVTDDATGRITIHLRAPQGDFVNILATDFAAPVPASTPAKDESTHPPPSTGPYTIKSYKPGDQIVEVRNPHFDAATFGGNVPPGNPDQVVWDVIGSDLEALQKVIDGKDDWAGFHAIPPDKLASVRRQHGAQLRPYIEPNTYYFFMNTRVAPFTSVQVRRAVNYAIDRRELVRLYGGLAVPTENIMPPTNPQYEKHDLYPHDLAKARRLVAGSGFKGAYVRVWSHPSGPDAKAAAYLVQVLDSIGFKARKKIVNSAVYWETVGNQVTKAQIGFADWFEDYPHPLDWFDVLLNGGRTTKTNSSNYANFEDPSVSAEIEALRKLPELTPAVNRRWARLDEKVMQDAPWAPFLNREFTDFFSERVDLGCYVNQVVYGFDYSTICVK